MVLNVFHVFLQILESVISTIEVGDKEPRCPVNRNVFLKVLNGLLWSERMNTSSKPWDSGNNKQLVFRIVRNNMKSMEFIAKHRESSPRC